MNLRTILAAILLPLSLMGLFAVLILLFFVTLPSVELLRTCFTTSMYQVNFCPTKSSYSKLSEINPNVIAAVVASEDASFYYHKGFDWHEIQASFTKNLKSGGYKRGGSTISQQLVKNAFLTKEKSIFRKLREAALTLSLEANFTKDEIIERYLNMVEFGPGIFGVTAAAQHYFQRRPSELNLLQATFLAFLLPNPKEYSKSFSNGALTPFAKKSVLMILHRLESFRKISADTFANAKARVDEFPWLGISQDEIATSAVVDDFATDEQIRRILEDERNNQEAPEATVTPAETPSEVPVESETPPAEESDWD